MVNMEVAMKAWIYYSLFQPSILKKFIQHGHGVACAGLLEEVSFDLLYGLRARGPTLGDGRNRLTKGKLPAKLQFSPRESVGASGRHLAFLEALKELVIVQVG